MAEFALIAPVFLLLVAGVLSFGQLLFYWIQENHVANETARWAAVDRNPYEPTTLQSSAKGGATQEFQNSSRVCISFPDGAPAIGDRVKVDVSKPFTLVPLLGVGTITIRGSATMRIERFESGDAPVNYEGTCE